MENLRLVKDKYFNIFIKKETIQERIAVLGKILNETYQGKKPIFLGILNGSFMVIADLIKHFEGDCEVAFVKLASYEGIQSTGNVRTVLGLNQAITGRHIIIVEDIVDTGKTIHFFVKELKHQKPASLTLFTLLVKPEAIQYEVKIDYIGFEIENKFVIGYGLDYDGYGRNFEDIYQLSEPFKG